MMDNAFDRRSNILVNSRAIGFFTMFMLLTLNGDSGKDLLDVATDYISAKTEEIQFRNSATNATLVL